MGARAPRMMPSLLARGPVVQIDEGLALKIFHLESGGYEVDLELEGSSEYRCLGEVAQSVRDAWALALVQRLNRFYGEAEHSLELPRLPVGV